MTPSLTAPSPSIDILDPNLTGVSTLGGGGGFLAAKHTCASGSSKDGGVAFSNACRKFTGYDSSSSTGDVGSDVTTALATFRGVASR